MGFRSIKRSSLMQDNDVRFIYRPPTEHRFSFIPDFDVFG